MYGQEFKVEFYVRDSISGVSIEGAELYDTDTGLLDIQILTENLR